MVRAIVVQPRIEMDRLASYETFAAQLRRLVASEVVPRLAPGGPNLIILPEDVGLAAAFIGSRGLAARRQSSSVAAYLDLFARYGRPLAFYQRRFAGLAFGPRLLLALTDTLWRAFHGTLSEIAASSGAYVVATTNVSRCIERSTRVDEVAALADPDLPAVDHVYVARAPDLYNTAFVFSPDGEIVATRRKPYLVENEDGVLGLGRGALAEVVPVDLGFARLGILISKDAWMPDMVDRLACLGADVLVQPEAFAGWAIEELPGDWIPDGLRRSAWTAVQKHGALRYGLISHLVGNLFDIVFDGQSAVVEHARPGRRRWAYVGQAPQAGFAAVAPWVVPDQGTSDPSLTLAARRASLRSVGESLRPGGARANGYVETAIAADLDVDGHWPLSPDGAPAVFGASRALAPAPDGEQSAVAAATTAAGTLLVAFADTREGRPQISLARSVDGGNSFVVTAICPSDGEQRTAALVATPSFVYVAWQESRGGERCILVARSDDDGQTFAASSASFLAGSAMRSLPRDEWLPTLAADGDVVYLAFVATLVEGERVQLARALKDGGFVLCSTRELAPPPELARRAANQWSPALAARDGELWLAWVDFRHCNWDVLLARSGDGGRTFSPPVRVDDGGQACERLNNDPALLALPDGGLVCAWSDARLRHALVTPRALRLPADGPASAESCGRSSAGLAASLEPLARRFRRRAGIVLVDALQRLGPGLGLATAAYRRWAALAPGHAARPVLGRLGARFTRELPLVPSERSANGAAGPSPSVALNAGNADEGLGWRPRLVPLPAGRVAAIWQDFRAERNDVYLAISDDGGRHFGEPRRLDDGGDGPAQHFAPAVAALSRERLFVAWEDTRSGRRQIRFVVGSP